jgi:DNA primase
VKAALIKEIKMRLSLSSVIKTAVELKGAGPNFIGLCPFHEEKTPSFHVRDKLGRFKCFGCGVSGDAIEFVMRLRGLAFNEAVEELSEQAGIKDLEVKKPKILNPQNLDLLRAQSVAQEYFAKELLQACNKNVREYLVKNRGLNKEMILQAGLGFGGTKEGLEAYLAKKGISEACALKAGLLKPGRFSLQSQFEGRITFPIRNFQGQIIAFGGRILAGEGAKYTNTHNYEHYEKRKNFYGLFESKPAILKGQAPVLVEGYFDAMAFWALGVPALALCGTALSPEHTNIIKRLSSRLLLCFDADNAGMLALRNSLMELFQKDISPSLLLLNKKDAGEYLAENKISDLKDVFVRQEDALCYLIDFSAQQARSNISERIKQIDWLVPVLSLLKRPLVRRQYVAYLAQNLHEDPALLWWEINKKLPKQNKELPKINLALSSKERLLLRVIIADKQRQLVMDDLIPDGPLKEINSWLVANKDMEELKVLIKKSFPEIWPAVVEVLSDPIELTFDEALSYVNAMRKKNEGLGLKESLKKKRLELLEHEKNKDFSSALKSLKESSAMLLKEKVKPQGEKPKDKPKAAVEKPLPSQDL